MEFTQNTCTIVTRCLRNCPFRRAILGKEPTLIITDAIKHAQTKHVVYFLLTAYVEAVDHIDRKRGLPKPVKRLPIAGRGDVNERLGVLRDVLTTPVVRPSDDTPMLKEAADVFSVASEQLETL